MLTLLDLSAALDSVDRNTLLQRLRKSYGLGGKVTDCSVYVVYQQQEAASSHDDIQFGTIGTSFWSATRLGPRIDLVFSPCIQRSVWRDIKFAFFVFCLFVCTVEDISTQDGAIGVKFWLRV